MTGAEPTYEEIRFGNPARDYDLARGVLERVAWREGSRVAELAGELRRPLEAIEGWLHVLAAVELVEHRTEDRGYRMVTIGFEQHIERVEIDLGWHITEVGDLALVWIDEGPASRQTFAAAVRRARARIRARRRGGRR